MRRVVRTVLVIQLIALPFCLIPALASAGGQVQGQGRANSLEGGSWSMQFGITDELGLKPFNGMSVSLKRHTSARSAFRLGLNVGFDFGDGDSDQVIAEADTATNATDSNGDSNSQLVQVDLLYMRYPKPGSSVNLFLGTGPLFRYSRSEANSEISSLEPGYVYRRTSEKWSRSWQIGVLGVGGVEWFATRAISFHAEYRAAVAYSKSESDSKTDYVYSDRPSAHLVGSSSGSTWDFHGTSLAFGVSLYF
jgi:hypothetical protein